MPHSWAAAPRGSLLCRQELWEKLTLSPQHTQSEQQFLTHKAAAQLQCPGQCSPILTAPPVLHHPLDSQQDL